MNKKAAIELSANFLVIIIISLVIFGSGIYLFTKIYGNMQQITTKLGDQTQKAIQSRLNNGDKVSIMPSAFELQRGGFEVFGVGINNIDESDTIFRIFVEQSVYINNDQSASCPYMVGVNKYFTDDTSEEVCAPSLDILLSSPQTASGVSFMEDMIKPNTNKIENVKVMIPKGAKSGQYIINICVCRKENEGGSECSDMTICKSSGMGYDSNYPISKVTVTVK